MTPDFRLLADNANVTAKIAERLISLSVTDEDGRSSDTLSLTKENRYVFFDLP